MNWDERKKAKVINPEENDLRRRLLSDPLISSEVEGKEDIMEDEPVLEHTDSRTQAQVHMAAALVEQAMQGRWMPLEMTYHKNFASAKRVFLLYHRLYIPRAICILALVVLPFFEIPVWCQGQLPYPCGDPVMYQLSGLPYIDRWQSLFIELSSHQGVFKAIQLSTYLRVLVPVVFTRALRVCFRMTIRIVHTFADIAVLLGLFVLLSAYIATVIFRDAISEYEDFRTALLNLFVLLTTANNPNVWADAYTADRRAFFFFFTYLVVGLFFLMNLVFTVIYNNYKAQIANEVVKRTTARQECLKAAFVMLDTKHQGWIDKATMTGLLRAMSSYSQIPDFTQVFLALDKRGDFRIWHDEFESLCDVVPVKIEHPETRTSTLEPKIDEEESVEIERRQRVEIERQRAEIERQRHKNRVTVYNRLIWVLTLASVMVAICESEVTSEYIKNKLAIPEIVLGWMFVLDASVKITIYGCTKYWRKGLNQFDFFLTCLTMITQTAVYFHLVEQHWVSILFLVRGLRICSFITVVSRWHLMAQTVVHIIPATAPILALQFTVCTLFSLLGVHLFGGKIYLGNRLLEDSEYATGRLYAFNFNDYASAMVTSFNLCIVNNWYVIMDAYAIVTGSAWSRVFFVSFWAVAVAFTLNVVVAFFVESFVLLMERAETKKREAQVSRSFSSESSTQSRLRRRRAYSYYDLYKDIMMNSSS